MDFIILKINNIDVSDFSHNQVISILNKAKQPVQVEILTKENESDLKMIKLKEENKKSFVSLKNEDLFKKNEKKNYVDKQIQTDSDWLDKIITNHCNNLKKNFVINSEEEFYETLDDSENEKSFFLKENYNFCNEDCDEFEYKELCWSRNCNNNEVFITLEKIDVVKNYKRNFLKTELVYIKEVLDKNFLKVLKPGDQIIEINGIEIINLDEAEKILFNKSIQEYDILFSRLNLNHDHNLCEKRNKKVFLLKENFKKKCEEKKTKQDKSFLTVYNKPCCLDEKDSGIGKQTDQESNNTRTLDTLSSNEYNTLKSFSNEFDDNKSKCFLKKYDSNDSLEREMLILNQEMENIKLECEELNRNFILKNKESSLIPTKSVNKNLNLSKDKFIDSIKKKDLVKISSQKINSELERDNFKIKEFNSKKSFLQDNIKKSFSENSNLDLQKNYSPSEHEYAVINYENASSLINNNFSMPPPLPPMPPNLKKKIFCENESKIEKKNNKYENENIKVATMYTNKANLHQTILLQQKLLREALEKKNIKIFNLNDNLESNHNLKHDNISTPCCKAKKNKIISQSKIEINNLNKKKKQFTKKEILKEISLENDNLKINSSSEQRKNFYEKRTISKKNKIKEPTFNCKHFIKTTLNRKSSSKVSSLSKSNQNYKSLKNLNEKYQELLKKIKFNDLCNDKVCEEKNDLFTVATV